MSIESSAAYESEKKRLIQEEELSLEEKEARREYQKRRELLDARIDAMKSLTFLRLLIEKWLISIESAEKVIEGKDLNIDEITPFLEKIADIEALDPRERILPKSLRITSDEYLDALSDVNARTHSLQKLDQALTYIGDSVTVGDGGVFAVFASALSLVAHSLRRVQGNLIDIKRHLQSRQ